MLEEIAMCGGIAGCILAVIAIIAILVVKSDIKHMLDKDEILFDDNFALKKQAIENALNLVDKIEENPSIVNSEDFKQEAKVCYNQMLCVTSNLEIVENFKNLAILGYSATETEIKQFKYDCRKDIGLKTKKLKVEKVKAEKQPRVRPVKPVRPASVDEFEREEIIPMPSNEPTTPVQQQTDNIVIPKPSAIKPETIRNTPSRPMGTMGVKQVGRPTQSPQSRTSAGPANRLRRTDND